jgi:hypothetical protein
MNKIGESYYKRKESWKQHLIEDLYENKVE